MKNRFVSLVLVLMLLLGCVPSLASAEGETVNLNIAVCVGTPNHMDEILAAANEILKEKINVTIELVPLAFDTSKYNLLLTTGNDVDLIYTATWNNFQTNVVNGAYMPLRDLVSANCPELFEIIPQNLWDLCEINGDYYCIPSPADQFMNTGFTWREDLRKKYDLPEINSLESIEAYLACIKENEPDMIPTADRGGSLNDFNFYRFHLYNLGEGLVYSYDTGDVSIYSQTDAYREGALLARKWVNNGWEESDVISNTIDPAEGMLSGKYASTVSYATGETFNLVYLPALSSHPDWEIGFINFGEIFDCASMTHPMFTTFGLPRNCPHPAETLAFIKELATNQELYQLLDCGIEGVDYTVDADGNYVSLDSTDNPALQKESMGITGFYFSIPAFSLHPQGFDEFVTATYTNMEDNAKPIDICGFPEDNTSYLGEVTAVAQVLDQYSKPLYYGMVEDVDGGIAALNQMLELSGIDTILANVSEQVAAFMADR